MLEASIVGSQYLAMMQLTRKLKRRSPKSRDMALQKLKHLVSIQSPARESREDPEWQMLDNWDHVERVDTIVDDDYVVIDPSWAEAMGDMHVDDEQVVAVASEDTQPDAQHHEIVLQ